MGRFHVPAALGEAQGGDAPRSIPAVRKVVRWCHSGSFDVAAAPEYLSKMRSSPETDPFSGSTRLVLVFATHESTTEFVEVRHQIDARSGELSDVWRMS